MILHHTETLQPYVNLFFCVSSTNILQLLHFLLWNMPAHLLLVLSYFLQYFFFLFHSLFLNQWQLYAFQIVITYLHV